MLIKNDMKVSDEKVRIILKKSKAMGMILNDK
jgi:hypothetical protein